MTRFADYAALEAQLRDMLASPEDALADRMTKTERKRLAKAARAKPTLRQVYKVPTITVVLSCRPRDGGQTVRFAHTTKTVSRFEALLEAEKAAARAGFAKNWVVLDVLTDC